MPVYNPFNSGAVDSINALTGTVTLTTTEVPEGTNLYHTTARVKAAAVADAINNGTLDVAPSQNAVFDALALKEAALGNPGTNGYILSSLTDGTRSWIAPSAGSSAKEMNVNVRIPAAETIVLSQRASVAWTLNTIYYKMAAGTCTFKITIDDVDVTGFTALAATTAEGNATASAANVVGVGTTIKVVITSPVSTQDLSFTIGGTL